MLAMRLWWLCHKHQIQGVQRPLLQWAAITQALDASSNYIFWSGILIVYCVQELKTGCFLTAGSKVGELGWKMIFCIFNKHPREACQYYSCIELSEDVFKTFSSNDAADEAIWSILLHSQARM